MPLPIPTKGLKLFSFMRRLLISATWPYQSLHFSFQRVRIFNNIPEFVNNSLILSIFCFGNFMLWKIFFKSLGPHSFGGRVVGAGEVWLSVVALGLGSLQMNLCLDPSSATLQPLAIPFCFYSSVSSSIKWVGKKLMK